MTLIENFNISLVSFIDNELTFIDIKDLRDLIMQYYFVSQYIKYHIFIPRKPNKGHMPSGYWKLDKSFQYIYDKISAFVPSIKIITTDSQSHNNCNKEWYIWNYYGVCIIPEFIDKIILKRDDKLGDQVVLRKKIDRGVEQFLRKYKI